MNHRRSSDASSSNWVAARTLSDLEALDHYYRNGGTLIPAQCRAARGLLDWSQADMGKAADLSTATVRAFERGDRSSRRSTQMAIHKALLAVGVEPTPATGTTGPGVRFRSPVEAAAERDALGGR